MNWTATPTKTFVCGACGTTVSGLVSLEGLERVMESHAKLCKGFAPPYHETAGVGSPARGASEAGVTPGEGLRDATGASSGRGE